MMVIKFPKCGAQTKPEQEQNLTFMKADHDVKEQGESLNINFLNNENIIMSTTFQLNYSYAGWRNWQIRYRDDMMV
eukprot:Pgem_evm1s9113